MSTHTCQNCGSVCIPLFTSYVCKAECDIRRRSGHSSKTTKYVSDDYQIYEYVILRYNDWHPAIETMPFDELSGWWCSPVSELADQLRYAAKPRGGAWMIKERFGSIVDLRQSVVDNSNLQLIVIRKLT
jgi:hypothetical protein